MIFTVQELAQNAEGELIGDGAQTIRGVASLEEARVGDVSFFAVARYLPQLRKTSATAVFVPQDFDEEISPAKIRVANPAKAFAEVVHRFAPTQISFAPGIHPTAVIDSKAKIGANVSIQPHVVIESGATIGDDTIIGASSYIGHETSIGPNCVIYPQVTIRERCLIGARVTMHSGVVIGADGFGFEMVGGRHKKIPQIGIVQIDDDVEIGANTTIDRARFGRTWIQEGVKIDNLVQVAHNVIIGKHSGVAAQAGIAGSSRIGEHVMIGGQAGIIGHIEIGDRNMIGGQAAVTKNLPAGGGIWWGTPAVPVRESHQQVILLRRLGQLFARVKQIEKKLGS